jgi:Fe-S-cluster containining protein
MNKDDLPPGQPSARKAPSILDVELENQVKYLLAKIYQHVVVSLLGDNRLFTPGFIRLIQALPKEGDNVLRKLLSEADKGKETIHPIACKKGCSYCCGLVVKATEPELYVIFEHVLKTRSESEISLLMNRLHTQLQTKEGCSTRNERINVKCTFLKNDSCSIYEVRPLSCRAWNSIDVQACITYLTDSELDIPVNPYHYAPFDTIRKGIIKGLHVVGLEDATHELNAGILRLLQGEFGT